MEVTTVDKHELQNIFNACAKEHGVNKAIEVSVSARSRFSFKISKPFGSDKCHINVSDYILFGREDDARTLASYLVRKINGSPTLTRDIKEAASRMMESRVEKCPAKTKRARQMSATTMGMHVDIQHSIDRLLHAGLVTREEIAGWRFGWKSKFTRRTLGSCRYSDKTVTIAKVFDCMSLDPMFMDETVYHEICHIRCGNAEGHGYKFQRELRKNPNYFAVQKNLSKALAPLFKEASCAD
jgi:hypothetical protein